MNWLEDTGAAVASWWVSIPVWWNGDGWPWIGEWVKSPGFAGFAAVIAATLAFAGSRHQSRLNAWWQRIEWALNLYTKPDSTEAERIAGLAAVGALQQSRLAKKPEQNFVAAIIDATTLDLLGDGIYDDDLPVDDLAGSPASNSGFTQVDESYSEQEAKEETDDEERIHGEDGPSGPIRS